MWTSPKITLLSDRSCRFSTSVTIQMGDYVAVKSTRDVPELTIGLDTLLGARHVCKSLPGPLCCAEPNSILKLSQRVSSSHTGYFCLFSLDLVKDAEGNVKTPHVRVTEFACQDDDCVETISRMLYPSPLLFLFVLNPFGGTKKATRVYHSTVLPMLQLAGLESRHKVVLTQSQGHATQIAQDLDLKAYVSVTMVSGDGVFHEFLTGLATRADHEEALKMPLGLIGAGSANALAKNLDCAYPPLSMLAVLKGMTRRSDMFSCIQGTNVYFSHLVVFWALIADIDIESDRFRGMGDLRFTLAALVRLAKFRNYHGRLYMLPPDVASDHVLSNDKSKFVREKSTGTLTFDSDKPIGLVNKYTSIESRDYTSWPIVVDTNFQYFVASNMPWVSSDFLVDPFLRINSGTMSVQWAETMERSHALECVLDQAHGMHLVSEHIHVQNVVAFVLEPEGYTYGKSKFERMGSDEEMGLTPSHSNNGVKEGILDVSGEKVEYSPIKVEMHPSSMTLIVPSWMDDSRWETRFRAKFGQAYFAKAH